MRPTRAGLGFAALSLFFLGATLVWLRLDRTPPSWDDAFYLTGSLRMFDALSDGGVAGYAAEFPKIMATKPPLIAILPTPLYLLAGRRAGAAYGVNLAFLLVLFAALYRLGRRYSSRRAGLLAVYIAGTMPVVYGLARWYLVECGLMTLVAVTVLLLAGWTESAGVRKAFLLGVVCGLGLLMKLSFPLYVAAPILYFAALTHGAILRPKTLLAAAIPAALLTLPWYSVNFRLALATALDAGSPETAKLYRTGEVLSLATMGRYLHIVFDAGPTLYFIALLLLLLTLARKIAPSRKAGLQLCALWVSPFLFLLFGRYRELRYAAPLYPAVALCLAILIDAALERRGVMGKSVSYALLAIPMLGMLQTSFGALGRWSAAASRILLVEPEVVYARQYDPRGWPQPDIVADIYRGTRFSADERKTILIGTDSARFNSDNFELAIAERKLPFEVETTAYETDLKKLLSQVNAAAYFIHEEGGEPVAPFFNTRSAAVLRHVQEGGRFTELPIARTLPDGGVAHVFANLSPGPLIQSGVYIGAEFDALPERQVTFGDMLQLTGVSARRIPAGLEVKYRWRCLKPPDREYWCFTHVIDVRSHIAGYLDHAILNGDPAMKLWKAGDVAIERLLLPAPALREGESYRILFGLFERDSGRRLPIAASDLPLAEERTAALAGESAP